MFVTPNKNFHTPIGWWIIVTVLLIIPGNDLPNASWFGQIYLDKLIHIFLFFVLVYLFYKPLKTKPTRWILLIAILAFLYGIAMEFVQENWVVDRAFDKWDIVSDGIGCFLAFAYIFLHRKWRKRKSRERKSRHKK